MFQQKQSFAQRKTKKSEMIQRILVNNSLKSLHKRCMPQMLNSVLQCACERRVFILQINWFRAAHICKSHGMELAKINSIEENDAIEKFMRVSGQSSLALHHFFIKVQFKLGYGQWDYFWTSGNNLGAPFEWYWLTDGRPMNFTNWGTYEPNNNGDERCVQLRYTQSVWTWNNRACYAELYFICELKLKSS